MILMMIHIWRLKTSKMSDFDSEEILNKYFSSSSYMSSETIIDGKHLIKFWNIDRKVSDSTIDLTTQRRVISEDPSVSRD